MSLCFDVYGIETLLFEVKTRIKHPARALSALAANVGLDAFVNSLFEAMVGHW
jgi:hypothetical protein